MTAVNLVSDDPVELYADIRVGKTRSHTNTSLDNAPERQPHRIHMSRARSGFHDPDNGEQNHNHPYGKDGCQGNFLPAGDLEIPEQAEWECHDEDIAEYIHSSSVVKAKIRGPDISFRLASSYLVSAA